MKVNIKTLIDDVQCYDTVRERALVQFSRLFFLRKIIALHKLNTKKFFNRESAFYYA